MTHPSPRALRAAAVLEFNWGCAPRERTNPDGPPACASTFHGVGIYTWQGCEIALAAAHTVLKAE